MSIPLDRLYHYIENLAQDVYQDSIIIYRFFPHGSKNIADLNNLNKEDDCLKTLISPAIWCNDQEPLNYEFYNNNNRVNYDEWTMLKKSAGLSVPKNKNLNHAQESIFEKGLLLHSEKRSENLKQYQAAGELLPVYYWSHAIIAQDWFRYAAHETFQKNAKKIFLIYNRAWSGTREYRLKFADLLVENDLVKQCQSSFNPVEPELGIHYAAHDFKNPIWRPTNVLENFLQPTLADSNSSADFDTADYNSTDIEVVLETLFDDDRLHLTEKSLRPIACAQPFILVATHGSLEYLRSYGFRTFDTVWNESYDQIADPAERLQAVVDLMHNIATWDPITRNSKMQKIKQIVKHNQQWFFSKKFSESIILELKTNFKSAFEELKLCNNYTTCQTRLKQWLTYPLIVEFLNNNQNLYFPTRNVVDQVLALCQTQLSTRVQ